MIHCFMIIQIASNKYLSDNNPGALEKAVDLCIEYVKKASKSIIKDLQQTLVDMLITKSISHMKPSLQEKGMETIWCLIEKTEDYEGIADSVCKTFSNTNVKVCKQNVIHVLCK